MNKTIKKLLLIIVTFIGILMISNISNASELRLKNLDYDVKLNSDGTANVKETWKISIEDTNTLFKTFEIDKTKYKEITDVEVSELKSDGTKIDYSRINEYKYHVDKDKYYGLVNDGKFEIAWGVKENDATRTYEISYKVIDAVKNYNDVSEFYWQFINTQSEIPADFVTGKITLPKAVESKEDLKIWAHGPLNGNIIIDSNDIVKFEVTDLNKRTMLETRILTPNTIFIDNKNTSNVLKKESILEQEKKWAEEANNQREQIRKRAEDREKAIKTALIISNIIGLVIGIILIIKAIKYHKILKQNPVIKPEQEYQYYRDIPDENATPAQTAFLYYFKTGLYNNTAKVISATMLDLCIKKYIAFETIQDKKEQIKIIIKNKDINQLSEDEKIVYELLNSVPKDEENSFTMKQFGKYIKSHPESVLKKTTKIDEEVKKIHENKKNYDKEIIEQSNKWHLKGAGLVFLSIISIFFIQILVIPSVIAMIYCFMIGSRLNRLTKKGINEKEMWNGLKRYMEDFSNMKEKEVPELILWEKYLVYATVFGIADKVLKQLKVVYPQIIDSQYMSSHGYTYMYLMYSGSFNNSFINSLNSSINTTYTSAMNYSSGTGAGGGFSGGGGFGGGGGRNGRKIIY